MKKFPIDYLKPYDRSSKCLNVVVETPKGSRVKYAYEKKRGMYIISKALPEGMVFPYNFGFIPATLGPDGDPLDVLVLNEEAVVSNTLLNVKPVALIKATQTEGKTTIRNDRIIGQAIGKESPLELRRLGIDKAMVTEISVFFETYNKLYGKRFKVLGVAGPGKARKLVDAGAKAYKKSKK